VKKYFRGRVTESPRPTLSQTISLIEWSWRRGLNPRPSDYKSDALPTELRQHSLSTSTPEAYRRAREHLERGTGIESVGSRFKLFRSALAPYFSAHAVRYISIRFNLSYHSVTSP
jgi:hypothetical protein